MAHVLRILVVLVAAVVGASVAFTPFEAVAQGKKKKDDKKDDKDKKEEKKEEKKPEFKPDTPEQEFKYVEKDKNSEAEKTFWVYAVAFGTDGKTVAASYRNHAVKIWDLGAKKDTQTLKGPAKDAKGLADYRGLLYVKGQVYVGTGKWNTEKKVRAGEIRVWDAKSGKAGKPLDGHSQDIEALAISKDGKLLASASDDNTVLIWDLATGKTTQTLKGHTDAVISVAFSPDAKEVVTTSKDKSVRVWDIAGAKEIADFKVEKMVEVKEPKGKEPKGKEAKGKDVKGKVTMQKELGREFTHAVFIDGDKKIIASNLDGAIKIYDVADKKEVKELKANEGVWSLALSPDGKKLAAGGWDGLIKIWSLPDGKELQTIKAHVNPTKSGEGGNVTSLSFSPDGQLLASGGIDGTVKIWAVK